MRFDATCQRSSSCGWRPSLTTLTFGGIPPEDQRWPAFGTEWMTFIADRVFERGHTYLAGPIDVAVAWVRPDVALVGPDDVARGQAISRAREARAGEAVTTIMAA